MYSHFRRAIVPLLTMMRSSSTLNGADWILLASVLQELLSVDLALLERVVLDYHLFIQHDE
jgi:hypothetical protein